MHPSASAGVRLSAIVALAALVIFIVCPLGSIFITSFTGSENESLLVQHALDAALASENVETVVNSIVLAGLVVVLTTVMATPLALLLSRTSWGQSHWLDVALLIPFMTPPYIGAMGWILFMQKRGLLEQLLPPAGAVTPAFFSLGGLVFVMSLHALPFMTTIMKNALMRVPGNLEEAAAVSGAGFSKRLKQVLLPLVTGNYAIAMLLVFVKTLAEYGTPSTLGRRIGFHHEDPCLCHNCSGQFRSCSNTLAHSHYDLHGDVDASELDHCQPLLSAGRRQGSTSGLLETLWLAAPRCRFIHWHRAAPRCRCAMVFRDRHLAH